MKYKFTCSLCKKKVKRGEKNRVEIDQHDDDTCFSGILYEEDVCNNCIKRIEAKIDFMRK